MSTLREALRASLRSLGIVPPPARTIPITVTERHITRKVERERARKAYADSEAKRLHRCSEMFERGEAGRVGA